MEECKEKDYRCAKQLGDFGESLVMFILGNLKGYRVALVDHEGADLIATDREKNGRKLAVSVKSRWFKTDDPSYVFDIDNQIKLKRFSSEFDLIPTVAFVMIDANCEYLDVYILSLEILEKLANTPEKNGFSIRSGGFAISNALRNQQLLQNNSQIDHTRLITSKLNKTFNIFN